MTKPTELKPCPFCGGGAYIDGTTWRPSDGVEVAWVSCTSCGVYGPTAPAAKAIAAWNSRTPDPAVQALDNKEQLDIWAQEILEGLAFADVLKIESYEDKIEAHSIIGRGIVEVLRSVLAMEKPHDRA